MQSCSKRKATILSVTGMVLCLGASVAFATSNAAPGSIGSVAATIQSSFTNLAKVMTSAAYIIGVGFVMASLFQFKAHKDAPTQTSVGKPIALLFIGAAMIFIPSVMKTGGATVFGSNAKSAGISGISTLS